MNIIDTGETEDDKDKESILIKLDILYDSRKFMTDKLFITNLMLSIYIYIYMYGMWNYGMIQLLTKISSDLI